MIKSSAKVNIRSEITDSKSIFFIGGEIDEDSEFLPLDNPPKVMVLDLNDVRMINSCGLRNWILWIGKVDSKTQIILRNCPKVIVDQINILEGFIPRGAVVESFYVPYYCEACSNEDNILVQRGKDFQEAMENSGEFNKIPRNKQCSQCSETMDIAVLPEKYFRFFRNKLAS